MSVLPHPQTVITNSADSLSQLHYSTKPSKMSCGDASSKFHTFYETWISQLHDLNTQLRTHLSTLTTDESEAEPPEKKHKLLPDATHQLVKKVTAHYTEYYRAKSHLGQTDILSLFSSPWASSLERSLHWVTGFRPTTIFHLIYTEMSVRFEAHVANILSGRSTGDLGELSPGQLGRVSELQGETVRAENAITDRLSEWQDGVVGLDDWAVKCCGGEDGRVESMERLREVVVAADRLRMETIKKVVEVLTDQQMAELLVAAAELLFGIRAWGLRQDELRGRNNK